MKEIISVTDITAFMFCPRKLWLQKIKGIKVEPTEKMILGRIKHKALEIFNDLEKNFILSINFPLTEIHAKEKYSKLMEESATQAFNLNIYSAKDFSITLKSFLDEFLPNTKNEISVRIPPLLEAMKKFQGREIWENLTPKYQAELSLLSEKFAIKGRVDRVLFAEKIIPFEIKTRIKEKIFDSDKIQLAAYSLLLEDNFNKKIKKGIIEMKNKKIEIEITDELKNKVLEIAEKVRNIQGEFPSSFSKCQSCNLKEICSE